MLDSYLGYLFGAIIAATLTNFLFKIESSDKKVEKFNVNTFNSVFYFSWPFIFHGVSRRLIGNADKFIIEKYLSLNEVGQYTYAYAFGSSMAFAFIGISVYLEPLIYKEDDYKKRKKLLDKFLVMGLLFGTVAYFIINVGSIYILPNIYDDEYSAIINHIPTIALAFLVHPHYLKSNYKMIYNKNSFQIAIISTINVILNIVLNFYFIPIYGIDAAVLITVITYLLQSIMFVFVSNKFKFDKDFYEVLSISLMLFSFAYFKVEYYYTFSILIIYCLFIYIFKTYWTNEK